MMRIGGLFGLLVLCSLCLVCMEAEGLSCPAGFHEVSGSCYWYSDMKDSFDDAQEQCRKMGSNMAVVSGPEETALLGKNIQLQGKADVYYIGFRYLDDSRNWFSDGSKPVTTTTKMSSANRNCVVMRVEQLRIRWYNTNCDDKIRFICEYP